MRAKYRLEAYASVRTQGLKNARTLRCGPRREAFGSSWVLECLSPYTAKPRREIVE
jgi:hypothetical protein